MHYEQLNPDQCMSYLISDTDTKAAVIIDPKLDYVDFYMNMLKDRGESLALVIDTHTHADHLSGSSLLLEKTGCQYAMYEDTDVECVTRKLKDGDHIHVEGIVLEVIHTPGHTKDSICIVFEDKLFSGDFVFLDYGGGRNDLPTGDMDQHWNSLKKIKKLPDHLIVCPGHNYSQSSPSTLWLQRRKNPYFKMKDRKAFKKFLQENKPQEAPEWLNQVVEGNQECVKEADGIDIPDMDAVCQSTMKKARSGALIMSQEQFKDILDSGRHIVILDVRSPREIKSKPPIEGSITIPLGGLSANMGELKKYKNSPIVVVCRTSYKSGIAAKILMKSGFRKVYVLQGGIESFA